MKRSGQVTPPAGKETQGRDVGLMGDSSHLTLQLSLPPVRFFTQNIKSSVTAQKALSTPTAELTNSGGKSATGSNETKVAGGNGRSLGGGEGGRKKGWVTSSSTSATSGGASEGPPALLQHKH